MTAPRMLLGWAVAGAAAAVAVAFMIALADISSSDAVMLTVLLAATGALGIGLAAAVQRWSPRLSLRTQLALVAFTGLVVLALNVAAAAAFMLIESHDLELLLVLCLYALVTTIVPAQLLSRGIGRRIEAIEAAAGRLAGGELAARAPVDGHDEVAMLAREFNRMGAALEAANERRELIERSRRDLFASISHDLRTPLANIRAMVEALSDGVVADEATRRRYLEASSAEVNRLSLLIDDLFELTTLDSGELRLRLETLRVEDLVEDACNSIRPQVERAGIRLAFEPAAHPSAVHADPQRLSRVLVNLLQNAIRHTPSDGAITLRTNVNGPEVEVAVADTGDGIANEDLPFVFDRFYRGEKSRSRELGGAGLGLAIARGIVEAHGGRIWVESAPGRGATFRFTLPATT